MNFFSFQQYINELTASGSIEIIQDENQHKYYQLSKEGLTLLETLADLVPKPEKNRINRNITRLVKKTMDEYTVTADYTPENEYKNAVTLRITEGSDTMIKIELQTGSKSDAKIICQNWRNDTQILYKKIVDLLLGIKESD